MELIDIFHTNASVIDKYTFVFNEVQPDGCFTMLAMSEDGYAFSQWTTGKYDPAGPNEHLGRRIILQQLGETVLHAFFSRLSIPAEWEEVRDTVEQMIKEDQ